MKKIIALVLLVAVNATASISQPETENALKSILIEATSSPTNNSLAYRIEEIEKHMHSAGSWFGLSATAGGTTNAADRIGTTQTSFQLDGGNSSSTPTWGSWVLVFGSDDTPTADRYAGAAAYFDPHIMLVTDAEVATTYLVQFSRGASGAAGIAAGTYTEFAVGVDDDNKPSTTLTTIQTGRAPSGSLIWARCIAIGANTGTLDFLIGIHEYGE